MFQDAQVKSFFGALAIARCGADFLEGAAGVVNELSDVFGNGLHAQAVNDY